MTQYKVMQPTGAALAALSKDASLQALSEWSSRGAMHLLPEVVVASLPTSNLAGTIVRARRKELTYAYPGPWGVDECLLVVGALRRDADLRVEAPAAADAGAALRARLVTVLGPSIADIACELAHICDLAAVVELVRHCTDTSSNLLRLGESQHTLQEMLRGWLMAAPSDCASAQTSGRDLAVPEWSEAEWAIAASLGEQHPDTPATDLIELARLIMEPPRMG